MRYEYTVTKDSGEVEMMKNYRGPTIKEREEMGL